MQHTIVFAGAGSIQFAPMLLADVMNNPNLGEARLVMHDIDEARLDLTHQLALRMLPRAKSAVTVEATTDPRAALRGAHFVILSIELDRFETWDRDREIPAGLGIPQALGENGGPGGLFHALRMIPGAVKLAREIREICPDALVLNLSNPMSRICQAISLETEVTPVGLCHEIRGGRKALGRVLELPFESLKVTAAGLNHFTWFTRIEDAGGRDLYPELRRRLAAAPERIQDDRLLTTDLLRATGTYCVTNDSHAGEYLRAGHVWRCAWAPGATPQPFYQLYRQHVGEIEARVRRVLAGEEPLEVCLDPVSGEEVIPIIEAVISGRAWRSDAINIANSGRAIPDLPAWAIVEVPGVIDADGGRGDVVDDLPDWVMAMCAVQVRIHRLTARASLTGDRQAALEALLIDPTVPDLSAAERVFDALFEAHRPYLPMFDPR